MLNIISEMILLKNYTYDIKKHKTFFSNKEIYTHFPTFYDTNYYFYSSMFIQLIFNYYEAISQILFVFFDFGNLKKDKVGFSIIIDKLYEKYENDVSIKFIFEYKENEYKNLNEIRKEIVHYQDIESNIFQKYHENISNNDEVEKLFEIKTKRIDLFIDNHNKSMRVMEEVLKFIYSKR